MAQTPEQFIAKLQATEQALQVELPLIAQRLTGNIKALAEKNILEKGFGARYSEAELPVYFFKGKELNAGGRNYLESHGVNTGTTKKKRKKKGEGKPVDNTGTWAEFRQAQGRQTNFVDLSYANVMWRGLVALQAEIEGNKAISRLGATNDQASKEASYNYLHYGNFILKGLGENDFRILEQTVIDEINDVIQQKLL